MQKSERSGEAKEMLNTTSITVDSDKKNLNLIEKSFNVLKYVW